MINIINMPNFASPKEEDFSQLKSKNIKESQAFSQILNREKSIQRPRKDHLTDIPRENFKDASEKSIHQKKSQPKTNSNKNEVTTKEKIDQKSDSESTTKDIESSKVDKKDSSTKPDKEVEEKTEIQENIQSEEILMDIDPNVIEQILSMIQNLLSISQINTEEVEDLDITVDLIGELVDLEKEIVSLLETLETEMAPELKFSLEEIEVNLENLIDLASENKDLSHIMPKEEVEQLFHNLEQVKENIISLMKSVDFNKEPTLENVEKNTDKILIPKEEEKTMEIETTEEEVEVDKEEKTLIKHFNKDISDDLNKDLTRDNPGDNKTNQDILFNQNIINTEQNTVDNNIFVNVEKEQILEPTQFIKEVAQKAGAFLSKDKTEMNIQLSPENLGKISIKIGVNDGTLTGKIYAENFSVKEIIESNLNQLKDSLEEQGLSIAGLEVEVGDNSSNFNRQLYESNTRNKRFKRNLNQNINTNFITANFEQENINNQNPYLVSNSFEGLV